MNSPTPITPPTGIEAMVCEDIARRQAHGVAKYGQTLAENPLALPDWLQHAYEEAIDLALYLKRARCELLGTVPQVVGAAVAPGVATIAAQLREWVGFVPSHAQALLTQAADLIDPVKAARPAPALEPDPPVNAADVVFVDGLGFMVQPAMLSAGTLAAQELGERACDDLAKLRLDRPDGTNGGAA